MNKHGFSFSKDIFGCDITITSPYEKLKHLTKCKTYIVHSYSISLARLNMLPRTTFISGQGYSVLKSELQPNELDSIRKDLTVSPFVGGDFANLAPTKSYKLFMEGPTKIYMPKHYGIKRFGAPHTNRVAPGDAINITFQGSLRPEQEAATSAFIKAANDNSKEGGLLNLTCASGKCLGWNTPVLMYDGSIKPVQKVKPGDLLMGDDSSPRCVISTCKGEDVMYRVEGGQGAYVVNAAHILSLRDDYGKGKVIDINIEDYLALPAEDREKLYGFKVPVMFKKEFTPQVMTLDPYTAGALCIDSNASHVPLYCKINSRNNMLRFVDGVIRRAGEVPVEVVDKDPYVLPTHFIITLMHKRLVQDIQFMLTCCGIASRCVHDGTSYKLHVMTDDKSVQEHFSFPIKVTRLKKDYFYGFEIDGNHRFLLGNCTVTHNTVMAIYLICQIKQKSLVVVHKDFLLQQWRERIGQFCPNARIGVIKGQTIDVEDKDIVIASLQSLSMKDYDPKVFSGFGFTIVDEVHHTSAEVFCRALKKISFKYTLGLSATMKRKDGLSKVFMWYLGDVLYSNVKKTTNDIVHVKCLKYTNEDPDYCEEHYLRRQVLNIARMINNICEFYPRTQVIVDVIRDVLASEPERRIIVLSDRKGHLEVLGRSVVSQLSIPVGYYFGGMKTHELKESENKPIILGTFQMVSEGFDCKSLDTLVLASPKADVIQSVGRILREEASKRKYIPLVVDVMDDFSVFQSQSNKRMAYYKKQKYRILDINGCDITQCSLKEQDNKQVVLKGFAMRRECM